MTLDGKVVRESYGNNTIDYFYDNDGRQYKIVVNEDGTIYTGYYVLNLQGDVIALVDETGCVQVTYTYDAWGKTRSSAKSENIGGKLCAYNALRYRGYYYDAETGFYLTGTRYYDPEIGRFINADTNQRISFE